MNWLDVVYLSVAAFAATLAMVHLPVWLRDRQARANGALGFLSIAVAALALTELRVLEAVDPASYGRALWLQHFAALASLAGLIWCFLVVLRAGSARLGAAAVGLRGLFTLFNAFSTPNANFREITAVEHVVVFGANMAVPVGTPHPAMLVGQLSLVLAICFVVHATWQLVRRRERLAAVVVGLSFMLAIIAGTLLGTLAYWGFVRLPVLASPNFLPGLVVLAWWLSADLLAGRQLDRQIRERDASLRESEQRLALAASAVDAGIWTIDMPSSRVWATPRTLTMFGLAADRPVQVDDFLSRIHPDDRDRVGAELSEAAHGGGDRRYGFRAFDDAGRERWYVAICRRTDPGEQGGATLTGVTVDATELKQAETDALRARDDARAASAAKSAFLAQMSHEIRTPLHAILGHAELLQRSGPSPSQSDSIGTVEVACRHLLSVIEDVLDVARIEAGKMTLIVQPFSLHALVRGVAELIGPEAATKGLLLSVDLGDVPDRVTGDAARLRQAILNYAVNAIKFTDHGAIAIVCRRLAGPAAAGVWVRIEVRDTGPGIAGDDAARLFTAFARLEDDQRRARGGTGLGLAITREIARLMGGDAGVHSVPGKGSSFWLLVKLDQASAACSGIEPVFGTDDAEQRIREAHAGARVLLVEDNRVSRRLAERMLTGAGLAVTSVASGEEALQVSGQTSFDLVLMDLNMPGIDGLETTRRLRALPGFVDVPIVAVTGQAFDSDRDACLAAGMTGFAAKPVEWPSLWPRLLGWLDAAQSRRAARASA
jgi:PAS domain S-box-containing protein